MKRFFKMVGKGLLSLVVLFTLLALLLYVFSIPERAVARDFVLNATGGDFLSLRKHLHETIADDPEIEELAVPFNAAEPYQSVFFSGVSVDLTKTELTGTATDVNGCISDVEFVMVDNLVMGFHFTARPCPAE